MNLFKRTIQLLLLTVLQALILQAFAGDRTVTYYHTDHLGSPVLATDYLGRTVWKEDYGPWGERLLAPAGNQGDIGYTGHYTEQGLGLTYAQARWYDQVAGVFLSVDPVGYESGGVWHFGRFIYGNNNPFRFVDPDGRASREDEWAMLGEADPGARLAQGANAVGEGAAVVGDVIEPDAMSIIPAAMLVKFGNLFRFGKITTTFEKKIEKQMSKRGWDKDGVNDTIRNPSRTVSTRDARWKADGTRRDDPATAYIRDDGHYVVRNDNDGTIVQISDRNSENWVSPFD